MIKEMGNDAGVKGNKTNRSLCSLGVSLLHKHDVSEKLFSRGLDTIPSLPFKYMKCLQMSNLLKILDY